MNCWTSSSRWAHSKADTTFLPAPAQDVLGYACFGERALTHGAYDLFWIVTAPRAGRQGIGGHLLACVATEVRRMNGRLIIAETSGRPDYAPTRAFYEKYQYTAEAMVRDFYAPGDDLVIYVHRLD